jgi:hypothetical protein
MKEKHIKGNESKGIFYDALEGFAQERIREHLQELLEQALTEWLGRKKSERKLNPLEQAGYCQELALKKQKIEQAFRRNPKPSKRW